MKKLCFVLVSALWVSPLAARAEQMAAAVNYNPARMGVFDYLKVTDEVKAKKLDVTDFNFNGPAQNFVGQGNTVQVQNLQGAGTVVFPLATMSGSSTTAGNYSASSTGTPSGAAGTVSVKGGIFIASGEDMTTGQRDSFIGSLGNVGNLHIRAEQVSPSGSVHVKGSNAPVRVLSKSGYEAASYGFKLGGIDIPVPVVTDHHYAWSDVVVGDGKLVKVFSIQKSTAAGNLCSGSLACTPGDKEYCENNPSKVKRVCTNFCRWAPESACDDQAALTGNYLRAEDCVYYYDDVIDSTGFVSGIPSSVISGMRPSNTSWSSDFENRFKTRFGSIHVITSTDCNLLSGYRCNCTKGDSYVFKDKDGDTYIGIARITQADGGTGVPRSQETVVYGTVLYKCIEDDGRTSPTVRCLADGAKQGFGDSPFVQGPTSILL